LLLGQAGRRAGATAEPFVLSGTTLPALSVKSVADGLPMILATLFEIRRSNGPSAAAGSSIRRA
jgi:hypothetical protein